METKVGKFRQFPKYCTKMDSLKTNSKMCNKQAKLTFVIVLTSFCRAYGIIPQPSIQARIEARANLSTWCSSQSGVAFSSASQAGDNKIAASRLVGDVCYMQLQKAGGNQKRLPKNLKQACEVGQTWDIACRNEAYVVPDGTVAHLAYLYDDWVIDVIRTYLNDSVELLDVTEGYGVGVYKNGDTWYNAPYSDSNNYDNTYDWPFTLEYMWDTGQPTTAGDNVFMDHNTFKLKSLNLAYGFAVCQVAYEKPFLPLPSVFRRATDFKAKPTNATTLGRQGGMQSALHCADLCASRHLCTAVAHDPNAQLCLLAVDLNVHNKFFELDDDFDVYIRVTT